MARARAVTLHNKWIITVLLPCVVVAALAQVYFTEWGPLITFGSGYFAGKLAPPID